MQTFFEIAYNIILPIFLTVGVSMVVARRFDPDPKALSQLVVYVFTPFLVYDGMAKLDVSGQEAFEIALVGLGSCVVMTLLAWLLTRGTGMDRRTGSALMLSVVAINAGNYGLPLNKFAFGAAGEERALIFFVAVIAYANTVGVFLASLGQASARQALLNSLRVPLPYAVAAGVLVNLLDVRVPVPVERASSVLGEGAIPAMLVVLGLQLNRARLGKKLGAIAGAVSLRLVVSPLVVLALTMLIGMDGLARDVSIVQAGMPTAVVAGVLATEFGSDSEYVTGVILVSTLLSMITLSVILGVL